MLAAPTLAYTALLTGNDKQYDIARRSIAGVARKKIYSYGRKPLSQMIMFAPELISGIYQYKLKNPKANRERVER